MTKPPNKPNNEIEALSASLTQCYEELALLYRISDHMRLTQKPDAFFDQLVNELKDVVGAQELLILWNHEKTDIPDLAPPSATSTGQLNLTPDLLDIIWQRTESHTNDSNIFLIDSNVDGPYAYQWPSPINNIASVPVRHDSKLLGIVAAVNKIDKPDFDSIDTKLLLSVANTIAVFLENARLYDDLHNLLIGSLRALTSSIDAKDPYTCGHSERVAHISRCIAQQLNMSSDQTDNIYMAGLLHDVGKIGVAESVLCKPGRLTDDEFEQIKKHPRIGANILDSIKQMLDVLPAVLNHHERFDGSGYPNGLAGRNIPLTGRIVMLADSFDAMTSSRTYRNALPLNVALAQIRRFSGTQFDPELSDIFLDIDIEKLTEQFDAKNPFQKSPALTPV